MRKNSHVLCISCISHPTRLYNFPSLSSSPPPCHYLSHLSSSSSLLYPSSITSLSVSFFSSALPSSSLSSPSCSPCLSSSSSLTSLSSSQRTAWPTSLIFFSRHVSSSPTSPLPTPSASFRDRKVSLSKRKESPQSDLLSIPKYLQKSKRFPPERATQLAFELTVKFEWLSSATPSHHKSPHSSSSRSFSLPSSSPVSPVSSSSSLHHLHLPSSLPSSTSKGCLYSPSSCSPPPVPLASPPAPPLPIPRDIQRQWSRAVETAKSNIDLFSPSQFLSILHSTALAGISIPSFSSVLRRKAIEVQDQVKNPCAFVRLLMDLEKIGGLRDRHFVLFREKIASLLRSQHLSLFGVTLLLHLLSKHRLRDEALLHAATRRLIFEGELTTAIRQTPAILSMLLLSLAKLHLPNSCMRPLLNQLLNKQASVRLSELSCQELLNLAYALVCLSTYSQMERNLRGASSFPEVTYQQNEEKGEKEQERNEVKEVGMRENQRLTNFGDSSKGVKEGVRVQGERSWGVHTPDKLDKEVERIDNDRIDDVGTPGEEHDAYDVGKKKQSCDISAEASPGHSVREAVGSYVSTVSGKKSEIGLAERTSSSGVRTSEALQHAKGDMQPHPSYHEYGMRSRSTSPFSYHCSNETYGDLPGSSSTSDQRSSSLSRDSEPFVSLTSDDSEMASQPPLSQRIPSPTTLGPHSDKNCFMTPGVRTPRSLEEDISCRSTLLTNTLRSLSRSFFHPRDKRPIPSCAWNQLKFVDAYITHRVGPLTVTNQEALTLLARAREMPLVKEVLISQVQKRVGRMLHEEGLISDLSIEYPVGPFVLDFALPKQKLAVEIDGENHFFFATNIPTSRTRFKREILAAMGWRVVVIPEELWKSKKKKKVKQFVVGKVKEALGVGPTETPGVGKQLAGHWARKVKMLTDSEGVCSSKEEGEIASRSDTKRRKG